MELCSVNAAGAEGVCKRGHFSLFALSDGRSLWPGFGTADLCSLL
jgi:hypothetical protein